MVSRFAGWTPRERRVAIALAGTVLLGIIDLGLTLYHLTVVGLPESNPLARALLAATGSVVPLAVFKLLTIAINAGVLWRLRRFASAEIGSWLALAILVTLSLWWMNYNAYVLGNQAVYDALRASTCAELNAFVR